MVETARLDIRVVTGAVIASLHGEVDISNVEAVARMLAESVDKTRGRYIVDLTETKYLDSVAIRLLFSHAELLRTRRQELHIVLPPTSPLRRVLAIADVTRVIPTHELIEQALPPIP